MQLIFYLYNKQIYSIRDNAFFGLENLVQEIVLENNKLRALTALPLALEKLRLQVLNIQGNYSEIPPLRPPKILIY